VPSFRDAGEQALTSYVAAQMDEVVSGMKALPVRPSRPVIIPTNAYSSCSVLFVAVTWLA
jgi:hypothetical protein